MQMLWYESRLRHLSPLSRHEALFLSMIWLGQNLVWDTFFFARVEIIAIWLHFRCRLALSAILATACDAQKLLSVRE